MDVAIQVPLVTGFVIAIALFGILRERKLVMRYVSSLSGATDDPARTGSTACEKCGSNIDINQHLFYYGKESEEVQYPQKTTRTSLNP